MHYQAKKKINVKPLWSVFSSISQKTFNGVKVGTLLWPVIVWKLFFVLPEPIFPILSPMTFGVAILVYACAINEEKDPLTA